MKLNQLNIIQNIEKVCPEVIKKTKTFLSYPKFKIKNLNFSSYPESFKNFKICLVY